jgi:hypothetical protein
MIAKARVNKFYQVIEEASQHEEAKVEEPAKVEEQAEQVKETDYRKSEKTSGYSPVKKKSRKRTKPATVAGGIPAPDA